MVSLKTRRKLQGKSKLKKKLVIIELLILSVID